MLSIANKISLHLRGTTGIHGLCKQNVYTGESVRKEGKSGK